MAHTPDDSALMLRYQDGDVAAFESLYRRHKDPVYRYLLRLCGQAEAAEDVFQEVSVAAIRISSGRRFCCSRPTWWVS